jgi:PAS domain-containing protein
VARFRYLETAVTNQHLIQEEIMSRLNSDNACNYSVENRLSSPLLSKNVKIRICKRTILDVVLCGCEIWTLTLSEKDRLMVFENRALRRIFGPKRHEVIAG